MQLCIFFNHHNMYGGWVYLSKIPLDTSTRCQWGCDLSNPVVVKGMHIQNVC